MLKQELQRSLNGLQQACEIKEYIQVEEDMFADLVAKMDKITSVASEADIAIYNLLRSLSHANKSEGKERETCFAIAQDWRAKHSKAYHSLALMLDDMRALLNATKQNQGATLAEIKEISRLEQAANAADMSTNFARSPYADEHRAKIAEIKAMIAARSGGAA